MTEAQAPKKKGMGPWAWIAIGCGGLIIIAFVIMSAGVWFAGKKIKEVAEDFEENPAKAAAEMLVKVNPEVEMVETDDEEGTMTIRFKETGETATFDYSEIKEGKFSFESSEGKMSFDATGDEEGAFLKVETDEGETRWGAGVEAGELPDWFSEYPGASEVQGAFSQQTADSSSGAFGFETSDPVADVLSFYREKLESEGFSVQENATSVEGEVTSGHLMASEEETKRHAQVNVMQDGDRTRVSIVYGANQG